MVILWHHTPQGQPVTKHETPLHNNIHKALLIIDYSPDSKIHGANMRPIWVRQDPGGPHVGPMNFAIWEVLSMILFRFFSYLCLLINDYQVLIPPCGYCWPISNFGNFIAQYVHLSAKYTLYTVNEKLGFNIIGEGQARGIRRQKEPKRITQNVYNRSSPSFAWN